MKEYSKIRFFVNRFSILWNQLILFIFFSLCSNWNQINFLTLSVEWSIVWRRCYELCHGDEMKRLSMDLHFFQFIAWQILRCARTWQTFYMKIKLSIYSRSVLVSSFNFHHFLTRKTLYQFFIVCLISFNVTSWENKKKCYELEIDYKQAHTNFKMRLRKLSGKREIKAKKCFF